MSNALGITKMVTSLVVSTGVGSIVAASAKLVVPSAKASAARRIAGRISVICGAAVLSNMVADEAVKYTERKIGETVEAFHKVEEAITKSTGDND